MNTTQLIICNSASLIVFAFLLIKLKLNLDKVKRDYQRLKQSYTPSRVEYVEGQNSILYNQKCHLENLVEAQSERLKQYQQLLNKD